MPKNKGGRPPQPFQELSKEQRKQLALRLKKLKPSKTLYQKSLKDNSITITDEIRLANNEYQRIYRKLHASKSKTFDQLYYEKNREKRIASTMKWKARKKKEKEDKDAATN